MQGKVEHWNIVKDKFSTSNFNKFQFWQKIQNANWLRGGASDYYGMQIEKKK